MKTSFNPSDHTSRIVQIVNAFKTWDDESKRRFAGDVRAMLNSDKATCGPTVPVQLAPDDASAPERLTRQFDCVDLKSLTDMLSVYAANVENALIQSGATPGKDYTIMDCFGMAMPFALDVFRAAPDAYVTLG